MLIIGIDPGYEGALAILDTDTGKASVYETPVLKVKIGGKTHRQYSHKRMLRLLQTACAGHGKQSKLVVIEEQHLFGRGAPFCICDRHGICIVANGYHRC